MRDASGEKQKTVFDTLFFSVFPEIAQLVYIQLIVLSILKQKFGGWLYAATNSLSF